MSAAGGAALQPERALKLLDALDGLAYALRTACAGYWGPRLAALAAAVSLALAAARIAPFLA